MLVSGCVIIHKQLDWSEWLLCPGLGVRRKKRKISCFPSSCAIFGKDEGLVQVVDAWYSMELGLGLHCCCDVMAEEEAFSIHPFSFFLAEVVGWKRINSSLSSLIHLTAVVNLFPFWSTSRTRTEKEA